MSLPATMINLERPPAIGEKTPLTLVTHQYGGEEDVAFQTHTFRAELELEEATAFNGVLAGVKWEGDLYIAPRHWLGLERAGDSWRIWLDMERFRCFPTLWSACEEAVLLSHARAIEVEAEMKAELAANKEAARGT